MFLKGHCLLCRVRPPIDWGQEDGFADVPTLRSDGRAATVRQAWARATKAFELYTHSTQQRTEQLLLCKEWLGMTRRRRR